MAFQVTDSKTMADSYVGLPKEGSKFIFKAQEAGVSKDGKEQKGVYVNINEQTGSVTFFAPLEIISDENGAKTEFEGRSIRKMINLRDKEGKVKAGNIKQFANWLNAFVNGLDEADKQVAIKLMDGKEELAIAMDAACRAFITSKFGGVKFLIEIRHGEEDMQEKDDAGNYSKVIDEETGKPRKRKVIDIAKGADKVTVLGKSGNAFAESASDDEEAF